MCIEIIVYISENLFHINQMMKIFAEHVITISQTQQLHSSDCRYGSCV